MTQDRNKNSSATGVIQLVGTAWNLAMADGLALISIAVFVVLLGRVYGSAALGQFSFAVALSSIAQTVADAGFDITLPRSIRQHPTMAFDLTQNAMRAKIVLSLCVLPIAIAASLVKDTTTIITTVVMATDVIPSTLAYGLTAALRGLNQSTIAARLNALYNVIPVVFCIGFIYLGVPLYVFAVCILAGDVVKVMHLQSVFNRHAQQPLHILSLALDTKSLFNLTALRQCWYEQRAVTLTNLFSSVLVRMPSVMLGWFATDAQHGVYAAASRFFSALRIIPGAVMNTVIPQYSLRDGRSPRIRVVVILSALCASLISMTLYFAAPVLIHLTFNFDASVSVLRILSFAFAALFMKTTLEAFLLASHGENTVNKVLASVTILTVVAYYFTAHSSVNDLAIVVVAAETTLFLVFTLLFIIMRLRTASMADIKA